MPLLACYELSLVFEIFDIVYHEIPQLDFFAFVGLWTLTFTYSVSIILNLTFLQLFSYSKPHHINHIRIEIQMTY